MPRRFFFIIVTCITFTLCLGENKRAGRTDRAFILCKLTLHRFEYKFLSVVKIKHYRNTIGRNFALKEKGLIYV